MAAFPPNGVADLVEKLSPSIVRVDAGHRFGGTGTAWSSNLVVTASHVVERDEDIEIGLDGDKTASATVVGRDESTDVALLRVTGATLVPATFRPLEVAGSAEGGTARARDRVRVGDFVVAVARPGKTIRASFGIVSVLGGEFQTRPGARIDRWLETDADISAGWSGGALIDLEGRALGMNNRGVVRHAHVTLPHVTLERVVSELAAHGKIRRGYLGVGVHRVALSDAVKSALGREQEAGVLVHAIEPKSHADAAGLLVGDTLVSVDGAKVESPWELASVLRDKVDAKIGIQLVRAGKLESLDAHT